MKRIYLIALIVLACVVTLNSYFLKQIKTSQLDFQKNFLLRQTELCGNHVEKTLSNYENDLNRIIFKYIGETHEIFRTNKVMNLITRDLESFMPSTAISFRISLFTITRTVTWVFLSMTMMNLL